MRNWADIVRNDILPAVAGDSFWERYLSRLISDRISPVGVHLAVFIEPYLSYILEGMKTVESRFAARRSAPYGKVAQDDVVLLKRSSGPVIGICLVSDVWFYAVEEGSWQHVREEFAEALCAQDPEFWRTRQDKSFATLMRLSSVREIQPVTVDKRDRRGWVVLRTTLGSSGAFLR